MSSRCSCPRSSPASWSCSREASTSGSKLHARVCPSIGAWASNRHFSHHTRPWQPWGRQTSVPRPLIRWISIVVIALARGHRITSLPQRRSVNAIVNAIKRKKRNKRAHTMFIFVLFIFNLEVCYFVAIIKSKGFSFWNKIFLNCPYSSSLKYQFFAYFLGP